MNDDAQPNETAIRTLYNAAEIPDIPAFTDCFTKDGVFVDESSGASYQGPKELGRTVEIYKRAFPDMHREVYDLWVNGDVVMVELALQGTHSGPLELPMGTINPTGLRMDAPCFDVFRLVGGKVKLFNCYVETSVIMAQLGVLGNLEAALSH